MTQAKLDHVIWDNMTPRGALTLAVDEQFVMRCKYCGDRYVAALPASMSMVAAICRQYSKEHRRCRPRKTEP